MRDLVEGNRSFLVRHLNKMYHRQWLCRTSPKCCRRSYSLEALILVMDLTAPVTADYICHRLSTPDCLQSPLWPRFWKDWAAGLSRSGLGERSGAALQNYMVSLVR